VRIAALTICFVAACSTPAKPTPMPTTHTITAEDWITAETIARTYLKAEQKAAEPISLRRFETTPFLFGARWSGGGARVLVYDGKVQTTHGAAALSPYFRFLGEARLRGLTVDLLDNLLMTLGIAAPEAHDVGAPWEGAAHYQDLFPAIVDKDGVVKYVVHYVEAEPPSEGPGPGSKGPAPLVLQRWSLQLVPVLPAVDWKLEGRVERPQP
jgi:hypothetical protein